MREKIVENVDIASAARGEEETLTHAQV